jgi:protein O-GlcNAc transferase
MAFGYTSIQGLSRHDTVARGACSRLASNTQSRYRHSMTLRTPQDIRVAFQDALRLHQAGKLAAAERGYRQILSADAQHRDSLHLLGVIHFGHKKYDDARAGMERALALGPDVAAICFNLARCLDEMGEFDQAIALYRRAQVLTPNDADIALGLGNVFSAQALWADAIEQFDAALKLAPRNAQVLNNKALALKNQGRHEEALLWFDKAISVRSNFDEAHCNKGSLLEKMKLWEEARESFSRAIAANPRSAITFRNRGMLLEKAGHGEDAVSDYWKALTADPTLPDLQGLWLQARLKLCDWTDISTAIQTVERGLLAGKPLCQPLVATRILQSREALRKAAQLEMDRGAIQQTFLPVQPVKNDNSSIRVGYISSDLHGAHPVYQAMIGVLEHHDKANFEFTVFHLPTDEPQTRPERLNNAGIKQIELSGDDAQSVDHIRACNIDIAIDLNGHTKFNRHSIFAARVAPLQVNFLGFPGTMGRPHHDYVIADKALIPLEHYSSYDERVVWMPNSFFPVDGRREIAEGVVSRAAQGLPENAFVFGCFCTIDRILPSTFASWMSILKQVQHAVLWLKIPDGPARQRLLLEARKRDIEPSRLIFANRTESNADHLARLQLMDVCLDTLPYNAHMTAVDALFVGVPVLTVQGETFAGRVASSLLGAAGLPELICQSRNHYEKLAVKLAGDAAALQSIRTRLKAGRQTSALFDSKIYTHQLEIALRTMHERRLQNMLPEHFSVAAGDALG